ncbi:YhhN-like protein [Podospora australis]|uniref:YhhN-like protein n=1 Tax=Podospora australis TaxID=1536484 RepID=A0AAN6WL89_9PEZI|nr:YhhN-like protein [Podospora australis]
MSSPAQFTTESAVLAASVGAAVLYQSLVRSPPSFPRMVIKTASTALLSATSFLRGGPFLLVGALGLGSVGDAFLAWDDETSFIFGLASFLVAHILYILLFLQNGPGGMDDFNIKVHTILSKNWRAAIAGALALLVPFMISQLMPRIGKDLRAPVVVYSLVIFVMALTALTLQSSQVILGAVMFTSSDSILAAGKFLVPASSGHHAWMHHAVWVLYYAGQLLIALGFLSL